MPTLGRILLVEDDPSDVELTLTALEDYKLANEGGVARDGQQALDYLRCQGEYKSRPRENPAVLLLDLKLPKLSGQADPKLDQRDIRTVETERSPSIVTSRPRRA